MPEGGFVRPEAIDWLNVPAPVHYTTPVEVFDYAWASALVDQVRADVSGKFREKGKSTHWEVFQARVLNPIMEDTDLPSLTDLYGRYARSWEFLPDEVEDRETTCVYICGERMRNP